MYKQDGNRTDLVTARERSSDLATAQCVVGDHLAELHGYTMLTYYCIR